jgi:hypothetical protein
MKPLSKSLAWSWSHLATQQLIAHGVSATLLWHDESGNAALVLTFERGATLSRPVSPVALTVEIYVLAGAVADEHRIYAEGTFVHMPGDEPRVLSSPAGGRLFIFVRESGPTLPAHTQLSTSSAQSWKTMLSDLTS